MSKKGFLDKTTRTSIMIGVIICLSIAILFCIIRIAIRPKEVAEDTNFYLPKIEEMSEEDIKVQIEKQREEVKIEVVDRARIIEDNVNVRSGPGTDYDRVGSAYKGFDYEILSTDNSEWIKIKYDDKAAYIFAEYVEIVPMVLNDMGEYEEYVDMNNSDANNNSSEDSTGDTSAETDNQTEDNQAD